MQWVKIADAASSLIFNKENLCEVIVQGKRICLAKKDEGLLAFSGICPHAGARLSEGYVDSKGQVVCPLHGFKFNLETGKQSCGEPYLLKIFEIKQVPEGLFVGFP